MTNISNYFEQAELAFAAYSDLETEMTDAAYKLGIIGDRPLLL